MSFFAHAEEETKHPGKPLHLFREALKQAFCQCCTFRSNSPTLFNIEEYEFTDDDDDGADDEQEVVIRVIRARAMEARMRRKNGYTTTQNLLQVLNSMNTELINNPNLSQTAEEEEDDEEKETYLSAGSCFSRCSSASGEVLSQCSYGSREVFFSPRSCLSHCPSKKATKLFDANERCLKTKEPCHCEGWPFGLCKKAMLLPPLPNSPSESWSWRKGPPHLLKR